MHHTSCETTEAHLKYAMKKEYHKAEQDKLKDKIRHLSHLAHMTPYYVHDSHDLCDRFVEPVGFIIPSRTYLQDNSSHVNSYLRTGVSSRYEPLSHSYSHSESKQIKVPTYLAERNIRAVTEKPKSKSKSTPYVKCGVPECHIEHSTHYCNVCGCWSVTHSDIDCPTYRTSRY